jgi:hypothetical protein
MMIRQSSRLAMALRLAGVGLISGVMLQEGQGVLARADDRPVPPGPAAGAGIGPTQSQTQGVAGEARGAAGARAQEADAEVYYQGTPAPGTRITLSVNVAEAAGVTCRWTQVEGPPVVIDDPTRPQIRLTIPQGARRLAFLVTVKDGQGERTARVVVPIGAEGGDRAAGAPRAEAGDDQIGLVGRRITLNGSRSTPAGRIACYRWIQVGGPKVAQPAQEAAYFAFTPAQPGVHRFLLVVSAGDVISEPDEVEVVVGELARDLGARGGALGGASPVAEGIADVFEAIAERADLYSTFDSLSSEMMRRLDAVVPKDPPSRQIWSQAVFAPLSQHLSAEMLAAGLDLRLPQGQQQELTRAHKERLQQLLRGYAQFFRLRSQAR